MEPFRVHTEPLIYHILEFQLTVCQRSFIFTVVSAFVNLYYNN